MAYAKMCSKPDVNQLETSTNTKSLDWKLTHDNDYRGREKHTCWQSREQESKVNLMLSKT